MKPLRFAPRAKSHKYLRLIVQDRGIEIDKDKGYRIIPSPLKI